MHPDDFHEQIDQQRLVAALAEVERDTGGKVFVYVSHRPVEDVMEAAQRRFAKLGPGGHHHRHHAPTALIYIAPKTHKFAILGNPQLHDRCGDALWQRLVDALGRDLKAGDITAALLNSIASLKAALGEHFPA